MTGLKNVMVSFQNLQIFGSLKKFHFITSFLKIIYSETEFFVECNKLLDLTVILYLYHRSW